MNAQIIAAIIGAMGAIIAAVIKIVPQVSGTAAQKWDKTLEKWKCFGLALLKGKRFWLALLICLAFAVVLGHILSPKQEQTSETISTGLRHTVGLRKNGTVVAVGDNDADQCKCDRLEGDCGDFRW